jgi:hypothetical protein
LHARHGNQLGRIIRSEYSILVRSSSPTKLARSGSAVKASLLWAEHLQGRSERADASPNWCLVSGTLCAFNSHQLPSGEDLFGKACPVQILRLPELQPPRPGVGQVAACRMLLTSIGPTQQQIGLRLASWSRSRLPRPTHLCVDLRIGQDDLHAHRYLPTIA